MDFLIALSNDEIQIYIALQAMGEVYIRPMAYTAGVYPGFCSMMMELRVFLLPPGWDAGPSQGYTQAVNTWVERGNVRVVSCSTTQCNDPGQVLNQDCSIPSPVR